jgi:hypothetical protein
MAKKKEVYHPPELDEKPEVRTASQETSEDAVHKARPANTAFTSAVEHAFERADQRHVHIVERRIGGLDKDGFRDLIYGDVDYHPDRQTKDQFKQEFNEFRMAFKDLIDHSGHMDAFYAACESFIEEEQYMLFFVTNDMVAARVHQDYFSTFLDEALPVLEATKQLTPEWAAKFAALRKGYNLVIESYDHLRGDLREEGGPDEYSILKQAESLMKEAPQDQLPQNMETHEIIDEFAHMRFNQVMEDFYYTQFGNQHISPMMLSVLRRCEMLAEVRLKNSEPATDFEGLDADSLKKFKAVYFPIVNRCLERIAEDDSIASYVAITQELNDQIRTEDRLPVNFEGMLAVACETAAKAIREKAKDYVTQDVAQWRTPFPRSHGILEAVLPNYYTPQALAGEIETFIEETRHMQKALNKDTAIHLLEDITDACIDQCMQRGAPPSSLLAAQEYIAHFRRTLGQAMQAAGASDPEFFIRIKEIEDKCAYAYESRGHLGDWCMEGSANGVDNPFHWAWMQRGWDPNKLDGDDMKALVQSARINIEQVAQHKGISEELATKPFIPLIFARCYEIAAAEMDREQVPDEASQLLAKRHDESANSWRERILKHDPASTPLLDGEEIPQATQKVLDKMTNARALEIMQEALKRITPSAGHPPQEIAAENETLVIAEDGSGTLQTEIIEPETPAPTEQKLLTETDEGTSMDDEKQTSEPPTKPQPRFNGHTLRMVMDYLDRRERQIAPHQLH